MLTAHPGAQGGAAASVLWLLGRWLQGPAGEIAVPAPAVLAGHSVRPLDAGVWGTDCPDGPVARALRDLTGAELPDGPELRAFLAGLAVGVALGPLVDALLLLRRLWARCLRRVEHRFLAWIAGDTRVPLQAHVGRER